MPITKIPKLPDNLITSDKIVDNTIVNADVSPSAGIVNSKTAGLASISSTLTSACATLDKAKTNISLLGFKMAVNESLTVFNLVDGVVDEFNDESGTDESEGSNDLYCASNDYYINSTQPGGVSICIQAGYGNENHLTNTGQISSPALTASSGLTPGQPVAVGTMGEFTVPTGMTSVSIQVWGAGGGGENSVNGPDFHGGGGGYASGTLAVTGGQTLKVIAGMGGARAVSGSVPQFLNGGKSESHPGTGPIGPYQGAGGGLSGVFATDLVPLSAPQYSAPQAYIIGGSGGGGSGNQEGGAGGGLQADAGGPQGGSGNQEQTSAGGDGCRSGGGGSQTAGGAASGGSEAPGTAAVAGSLFAGGAAGNYPSLNAVYGGGGAGFYGGGGGGRTSGPSSDGSGGGGSSYYGHPQITSGSTEDGGEGVSGGQTSPFYPQIDGSPETCAALGSHASPGYVLITGSAPATATSTTIVSSSFSSTSVPSTSRIVVFEENVDTPTLNTDIIASISRDGGSTYTTATLSDSGYVTGSSGQRILTGQATISGQPSGQSMRWKLALANNAVKIHGVSLSWA